MTPTPLAAPKACAVDVHVGEDGLLVVDLGRVELTGDSRQLLLVGLLVDPALVDVDLDQSRLARLELRHPLLRRGARRVGVVPLLVDLDEHVLMEEPQVLARRLEPA